MAITGQNWFSSWFDTPYYHILYKDRGYSEAENFMKNLVSFLELEEGTSILDLACGKGRHSIYLNKLGYNVTGVDLSRNSIDFAKQYENSMLKFQVQDMSEPLSERFDAVFNLFTSFGYFDEEEDNLNTIKAISTEMKEEGYGVIDFMNVKKVIPNLVPSEIKRIKSIDFHITRFYHNGSIVKNIQFEDNGTAYNFTERVKAITLADFQTYLRHAGLQLRQTFGNYHLENYNENSSDRLILVFSK